MIEYKVIRAGSPVVEDAINALAGEGWRVEKFFSYDGGASRFYDILMSRPKGAEK